VKPESAVIVMPSRVKVLTDTPPQAVNNIVATAKMASADTSFIFCFMPNYINKKALFARAFIVLLHREIDIVVGVDAFAVFVDFDADVGFVNELDA